MKKKVYGYKIRNKNTGKYLASSGSWTSMGKVYIKKGAALKKLNTMLRRASNLEKNWKGRVMPDWQKTKDELLEEILQCEIVELCESNSYPIIFEIDKIKV